MAAASGLRRRGTTAGAIALVALPPAVPATAAAAWHAPEDLSVAVGSARDLDVAVAADGTATAIWTGAADRQAQVLAVTRRDGGAFAAPVELSAPAAAIGSPRIAVAADGAALAAWLVADRGGPAVVVARIRPPGAAWGPARRLSRGRGASALAVAIAPGGRATAVWLRSDGRHLRVQAATRGPGRAWAPPVGISTAGRDAGPPSVAIAPDGAATVVWAQAVGRGRVVEAATRGADGAWPAPVALSADGASAGGPQVAVAESGAAIAVWTRAGRAQAARRPAGGAWGAPVDLSRRGAAARGVRVAVAPDGTALAAWLRADGAGARIQASAARAGAPFGAPVDVAREAGAAADPALAIAPDGSAVLAWLADRGAGPLLSAVVRGPGARWGRVAALAGAGAGPPEAGVAPGAAAVIVATRVVGGRRVASARTSVAAPASLAAPWIDGTVGIGRALLCRPGVWSGASAFAFRWLRDGAPLAGATAPARRVHAADAGTSLACRVTARNRDGRRAATSRPLEVPPQPWATRSPTLRGEVRVGAEVGCAPGTWQGGVTRLVFAWLLDGNPIAGADARTYRPVAADRGHVLSCRVTARGPGGTGGALSRGRVVAPAA